MTALIWLGSLLLDAFLLYVLLWVGVVIGRMVVDNHHRGMAAIHRDARSWEPRVPRQREAGR